MKDHNNRVQQDKHEGALALSGSHSHSTVSDEDSVELVPFERERISLPDKVMVGCAVLTLVVPVLLLIVGLIWLSFVQEL